MATSTSKRYATALLVTVAAFELSAACATLFLVDTGATRTVVSPTYARRLGLNVPDDAPRRDMTVAGGSKLSVPFVRVHSVAVDTARVPDLLIGVYDIFPGAPVIDGVL